MGGTVPDSWADRLAYSSASISPRANRMRKVSIAGSTGGAGGGNGYAGREPRTSAHINTAIAATTISITNTQNHGWFTRSW